MDTFVTPIISGVGTFATSIISNPTMVGILGVIIACGIAAFAFGVVKRFIKR